MEHRVSITGNKTLQTNTKMVKRGHQFECSKHMHQQRITDMGHAKN